MGLMQSQGNASEVLTYPKCRLGFVKLAQWFSSIHCWGGEGVGVACVLPAGGCSPPSWRTEDAVKATCRARKPASAVCMGNTQQSCISLPPSFLLDLDVFILI